MSQTNQSYTMYPHVDPPLRRPVAGSEPVRGTRAALDRTRLPSPTRGTTESSPGSSPGSSTGGRPGGGSIWTAATHWVSQWLMGLLALLYLLHY